MDYKTRSLEIIKKYQSSNGALVACPNFPAYNYCWLRDGSFIAYSLDLYQEYQAATAFYNWVNQAISNCSFKMDQLLSKKEQGLKIQSGDVFPTRYTLEGVEAGDDWGNFQLDGYGTWLWALSEHLRITGDHAFIQDFACSIKLTVTYLKNFWAFPNYDCWEEHSDKTHTSTLACIYGGLKAINRYLEDPEIPPVLASIKRYVLNNCILQDRLVKYVGNDGVDASLLWVALPFGLLEADDPIVKNTVREIETRLLHNGGVRRYPEDTYYGGGEWPLLSAWLGWYYSKTSRFEEARAILRWIEAQADQDGQFPEQVTGQGQVNDPAYIEPWIKKWGQVAKPLLWSHAMYLVLRNQLK
ncbi:MAG: glycoside hydrolase family 15 protein [Bacillota bacterium]